MVVVVVVGSRWDGETVIVKEGRGGVRIKEKRLYDISRERAKSKEQRANSEGEGNAYATINQQLNLKLEPP